MSKMSEVKTKESKLVCVTGLVNKGKSTAMKIISSYGYDVFIMDEYIHQIYNRDEIGYIAIQENFGKEYVNEIQVDRDKLRELILSDSKFRDKLNSIMFPIMLSKLLELKKESKGLIFAELGIYIYGPKFFDKAFDLVIAVNRDEEITEKNPFQKIKNVIKFSTKDVGNLENNEYTNTVFVDFIVDNNSTLEKFKNNIKKILEHIDK